MRVRWTASAARDLYSIIRYIRRDNPTAAREIGRTLYVGCESLMHAPFRGRQGQLADTRELVFAKLPYIAVYEIIEDVVQILHLYHGAQDWPQE